MNRPKFNNTSVTVIASIVFAAFLFLLPTGFEGALQFRDDGLYSLTFLQTVGLQFIIPDLGVRVGAVA